MVLGITLVFLNSHNANGAAAESVTILFSANVKGEMEACG